MLSTVKRYVQKLDFLGSKFEMNFKGNSSYTTSLGGCITIIDFFLISFGVYIFISQLLDTNQPGITISTNTLSSYNRMNIFNDRLFPAIGIFNGQKLIKTEDLSRYISVRASVITMKVAEDPTAPYERVVSPIEYIPCKDIEASVLKKYIDSTSNAKNFYERFALCPNIKDESIWEVNGSLSELPFTFARFQVFPCTLDNPLTECATFPEIAQSALKVGMLETTYDLSNQKDPLGKVINFDTEYYLNPRQLNQLVYYLQKNEIYNNIYDFYDSILNSKYVDVEKVVTTSGFRQGRTFCSPAEIVTGFPGTCREYISFDMRSGNKLKQIQRRYQKPLNTIGDIGGYVEMILIICRIIYIQYNAFFYHRFLKKEVMCYNEKEMKKVLRLPEKAKVGKAMDKILEKDFDAISLFRNVNNLSILENILFKKYHRKLLPVVLLQINLEKVKRQKDEVDVLESEEFIAELDDLAKLKPEQRMALVQKAYIAIKNAQPKTKIQKSINQYFLDNLPRNLEHLNDLNDFSNLGGNINKIMPATYPSGGNSFDNNIGEVSLDNAANNGNNTTTSKSDKTENLNFKGEGGIISQSPSGMNGGIQNVEVGGQSRVNIKGSVKPIDI